MRPRRIVNRQSMAIPAAIAVLLACLAAAIVAGSVSSAGPAEGASRPTFESSLPNKRYLPLALNRCPRRYFLPIVMRLWSRPASPHHRKRATRL